MKMIILWLCLFLAQASYAQHTLQAYIFDQDSRRALPGATVSLQGTQKGGLADAEGFVSLSDIPSGTQALRFSYVGYQDKVEEYNFPLNTNDTLRVFLEAGEDLEEITVTATRSSRTIDEIPTRIEVLSAEELGEKAVMNSTNIAMLLRESTGILMQQTSASSANQSIRIQGLDGRYTQLLRDGFPLYAGFAGGLSIMQIPPLDLKQVEVIKGSASTLYGGGAIAGLVNLVTKQPEEGEPELSLMLNQTSALGTTLNGFYAERYDKTGASLYASAHRQEPYDPNDDGFSDIPQVRSITLNPRFYFYPSEDATLWMGVNTALEERTGGDLEVIENGPSAGHRFTEENISERFSTQVRYEHNFGQKASFVLKNSIGRFDREIRVPDFRFQGLQWNSFTEASYSRNHENFQWIAGANLLTDRFSESGMSRSLDRDYENVTYGGFAQANWDISPAMSFEGGLRTDYNDEYGTFVLPRLSLLYQFSPKLSARIGGGMGYVLPTIFTEQAESLTFQNILPIAPGDVEAETSSGANFDVNYKTLLGEELTFSLNQLFYYTRLNDALVLSEENDNGLRSFRNAEAPVVSRGFETNIKFGWRDLKLFLQYAFIDARLTYLDNNPQKPLTPRHNAGAVLMFEQHGKWRIGLESYYTGSQFRSDRTATQDFWIVGLMGLREWGKWSFFLNFENFIDTRQSRFQEIVRSPITDPTFAEIWAPTDGFVANGGFIYRFLGGEH
jgi:iron complex outermembrane receptor protein